MPVESRLWLRQEAANAGATHCHGLRRKRRRRGEPAVFPPQVPTLPPEQRAGAALPLMHRSAMTRTFTESETAILRIVQRDLPPSLTPYADIAAAAGVSEEAVLAFLSSLKEEGVKHQKAGFTHNAMTAWKADEATAATAGPLAARHPAVSHCYYRPSTAPDWPYTLYTMIHGTSEAACREVIRELIASTPLKEYAVLRSIRELKKISMTYF